MCSRVTFSTVRDLRTHQFVSGGELEYRVSAARLPRLLQHLLLVPIAKHPSPELRLDLDQQLPVRVAHSGELILSRLRQPLPLYHREPLVVLCAFQRGRRERIRGKGRRVSRSARLLSFLTLTCWEGHNQRSGRGQHDINGCLRARGVVSCVLIGSDVPPLGSLVTKPKLSFAKKLSPSPSQVWVNYPNQS